MSNPQKGKSIEATQKENKSVTLMNNRLSALGVIKFVNCKRLAQWATFVV